MKRIAFLLLAVATLAGFAAYTATASLPGVQEARLNALPQFMTKIDGVDIRIAPTLVG